VAHSIVTIPVPEVEWLVRPRLALQDPRLIPADEDDTVAHLTVLGPFTTLAEIDDGTIAELTRFFADVTAFRFTLTGVHQFPGGAVYLGPEPAAPFRQLTHALHRRFPHHPPYGGAFDDVVPHVTVPMLDGEGPADLERALAGALPVRCRAAEAALYWWEEGACRTVLTFPFGVTAA
jgi:2'-5' RNA ligase